MIDRPEYLLNRGICVCNQYADGRFRYYVLYRINIYNNVSPFSPSSFLPQKPVIKHTYKSAI